MQSGTLEDPVYGQKSVTDRLHQNQGAKQTPDLAALE
jgi:hypothetical protein